jgi:lipopolysaccharide/colanic/teichoic acid biosynthesis glycosyltransferase/glycosyltransferase involved in cell wall biosynthesis
VAELLFAGLAALFFLLAIHPFVIYPLSLVVLHHRTSVRREPSEMPGLSVSVCVAAYNEAAVIRAKADNLLAIQRRHPGTQILVYVDAGTDATPEILREYGGAIEVVEASARTGKTVGMQTLAARADGDILVFSDANVMFAEDAVEELLKGFADPSVACVTGRLVYTNPDTSATAAVGTAYWRLEERIKRLEDAAGTVLCADGSIFAVRRALYPAVPADIIDDFYVSLSLLCDGWTIRGRPKALAFEQAATARGDEFHRKVRIACQAFNVHRLLWPRLRAARAGVVYRYLSHKFLRWFAGPLLAVSASCAGVALGLAFGWAVPVVLATAGGVLLLTGERLGLRPMTAIVEALAAFTATTWGVIRSLRGERFQTWTPAGSVRAGDENAPLRRRTPISANRTKRAFDILGAAALVIAFAPLMLVVASLVRRDGGPALFGHTRIGAGGRTFRCLKFRTMSVDAQQRLETLLAADPVAAEEWRRTRKLRADPRITAFGAFLRSTSIDELPQLFNVLRGEMSLVGPRPIVADEVPFYDRFFPYYAECRPGMTGLWQVSGRSDVDYARRVALDCAYVTSWSIAKDLAILLRTPATVVRRRGAY